MPKTPQGLEKDLQYYKFCLYGFLKDLRFFEPFMLLYLLEKGYNFLELGSVYALREILINVLEIPTGILADALGRRRTMVFSFAAYIISFVLFFLAPNFGVLLAALVFFSLGEAFRTGTHKAMIFEYLKYKGWEKHKAWYYGHTRSWSQAGSALSSILAALLVLWQGSYSPIFLFSIIPYVLDLLLMLSYPALLEGPDFKSWSLAKEGFSQIVPRIKSTAKDFFRAFKRKEVLKAMGNQALYTGYYKALKDFLQPLIKSLALGLPLLLQYTDLQRTAVLSGLIYGILYGLTVLSARQSGSLATRFGSFSRPLNLTLFMGVFLGLASGLLEYFGFHLAAIALYMGIILIENLRKPLGLSVISDLVEARVLASTLSSASQAETLFAALIAWVLGAFVQFFGLGLGILFCSCLVFFGAFFFRASKPVTKT